MTLKWTMLDRCVRRREKLMSLRNSIATEAEKKELESAIRSLEKGYDPPVCALEFRLLIRHD